MLGVHEACTAEGDHYDYRSSGACEYWLDGDGTTVAGGEY
jgi:hypothetical protein